MKRAFLIVLASLFLFAVPVVAASNVISEPDEGPYITQVDVYRHCLEDDDMLVVVREDIPYDTIPDLSVAQAYLGRFMEGSTEHARVTPYSYYHSGYDEGGYSMYLDAASAPAWEGSYTVELNGSPTLSWLDNTATQAVTGAVADDGGSQTDETTDANDAGADDVTLLPATPAINDAYYIGRSSIWSRSTLDISTQGEGTWTVVWEYYDGDGWEVITGYTDNTSGFTATEGNHDISFNPPSDWAQTSIQSITAYWVRARVSAYTSVTTQPLGAQIWVNSGGSAPNVTTSSMSWRSTVSTTATQALLYSHVVGWAEDLSDYWSIALTSSTAEGTRLSSYGEAYFSNVIPGLRTICPNLFSSSITVPEYDDADWQKSQSEATKASWPFDMGGMSQWFGLPSDDEVFRTLGAFIAMFFLGSMMVRYGATVSVATFACYGLLFVLAVPGLISPIIVAGTAFAAALFAGLVFILRPG